MRSISYRIAYTICYNLLPMALLLAASISHGQEQPQPCNVSQSAKIWFSNQDAQDTLSVSVIGKPCSRAVVSIAVRNSKGKLLYDYSGDFITHMPYLIYEPELNELVGFFVKKVIEEATNLTTADLSAYTDPEKFYDATNDFVVIPTEQYELMRKQTLPILWHATGDATWVHVVFDPQRQQSRVLMRGGVFE